MQELQTTRRVEFHDTDMAGIVHFSNFFRFMEAAEVEFLRARGLSVRLGWEGQEIGFPRVSARCDYLSPARFEDILNITVKLEKIGTRSLTFAFEFHCDDRFVAHGQVTSVCCRIREDGSLESFDIPARYRQQLSGEKGI